MLRYWAKVAFNFKGIVIFSLKFFDTVLTEIEEISNEVKVEVRKDHCIRLQTIGNSAYKLNIDIGVAWHQDYINKEYNDVHFRIVEQIYEMSRDWAFTLQDVGNVGVRLKDFIGKKTNTIERPIDITEELKCSVFKSICVLETESYDRQNVSQGTGFIVKDFGIVTCEHVVDGKVKILKPGTVGDSCIATVKYSNKTIDLAVLEIPKDWDLPYLEIGNSEIIEIGDQIVLTGYPNFQLGDSGIIKSGNICGFRMKSCVRRFLIDASIVAGNSGGPVFNDKMKVIGIAVTGADRMEEADNTEDHGVIPISSLDFFKDA